MRQCSRFVPLPCGIRGASHSVIGDKIVDALQLEPFNYREVYGVNGIYMSPLYVIDLQLPNGIKIEGLSVSRGDMFASDLLIGMGVRKDLLSDGDYI